MFNTVTMNTLLTANAPNLVVKQEIEISETVIQEQRSEAAIEEDASYVNLTPGSGRPAGAKQVFAHNDEAEVRKLAMSLQSLKCLKRFGNRKLAKSHMRKIHSSTQRRPKSCPICSRNFKDKSVLLVHMNHHHEKVCPICSVVVSGSEALKYHVESQHIGKVEYVCPICFKMSTDSASHEDHVRSHNGRRRYECEDCSKYYASPEGLERHRLTHASIIKNNLRIQYKCRICSKAYRSERNLSVHMKTHAGTRPFKCDQCPDKFLNRHYLQVHRKTHVSLPSKIIERKYKCGECPKDYTSRQALFVHRQSHMPECTKAKCSVCSKVFKRLRYLHIHMNIHNGSRPYKCDQCPCSYASPSDLARHRNEHLTEGNRLKCSICSKTLSTFRNLRSHLNIHTGMRPYQCDQCPNNYASSKTLQTHRKSHKDRNYKCSYCPKTYAEKYYLRIHMNTHIGARPFKCDQCPKVYSNVRSMARHRQSHSQREKYKCDVCSVTFTHQRFLTMHSIRYHNLSFKCPQCGRGYSTRKNLYRHYRNNPSHDNSSEFKCSICSKGFVFERSLNRHTKTHLETALHKCDECPKKFYSPSDLLRHRRIHLKAGKNLHKCPVCHETFTVREHIVAHMDAHLGPRPFKCNQCPKDYASRCALNGHLRKHSIKPGECKSLKDEGKDGELDKVADIQTALVKYKCKECDKEFISERNLSFHSREHEKELTPE